MAQILLTTFGSLGDLHPYIAVGLELRARGDAVTIGSSADYRAKVEGEGLGFVALGPDLSALYKDPEIMRRSMHPVHGTEFVIRDLVLPHLEEAYERTLEAARDADLIVGHPIAFATPIAADVLKKRWISVALQPASLLSAYDPMAVAGMPVLNAFRNTGPRFWKIFFGIARRVARRWGAPINDLRRRLGLAAVRNPVIDDMHSPWGVQAWFSRILAEPQPDWPPNTIVTGFPFYDRRTPGDALSPELARFLDSGSAPVVFTLGSSAVYIADDFYDEAAKAAQLLGVRAVLLTGPEDRNRPRTPLPDTIFRAEYAPYSELFSRAAATVHQGGIGTTAQALRSGKPMVIVPFSHDQPDNAMRVARIGAGRVLARSAIRADRIARELQVVLGSARYARAAANAAEQIAQEDGATAAATGLRC